MNGTSRAPASEFFIFQVEWNFLIFMFCSRCVNDSFEFEYISRSEGFTEQLVKSPTTKRIIDTKSILKILKVTLDKCSQNYKIIIRHSSAQILILCHSHLHMIDAFSLHISDALRHFVLSSSSSSGGSREHSKMSCEWRSSATANRKKWKIQQQLKNMSWKQTMVNWVNEKWTKQRRA